MDLLFLILIVIAVISRMYGLGDRVMSHDEVNHVVPAFDLFSGRGYRHDPVTHGPFQFHLMALSYFLFGDNDFTSRLPHALISIATVIFVATYFRKYLGKIGSLAAGILFTISPFMLFYGRYARNDAICTFLGVTAIYALLRYFESKNSRYLYILTTLLALNFSTKETAYIFTAQIMVFLFFLFIRDLVLMRWSDNKLRTRIFLANLLLIAIVLVSTAFSVLLLRNAYIQAQDTVLPSINQGSINFNDFILAAISLLRFAGPGLLPLVVGLIGIIVLKKYARWDLIEGSRAFSLLILLGTLVLPLLAPFLVRFAGMDPSSYSDPYVLLTNYIYIGFFFTLSFLIGSHWSQSNWWKYALLFYGIYAVSYTSFFTNSTGLLTGMVGSLGHWLSQQSVERGGQPAYYYAFFLIPIYEFLAAFGTIMAFFIGIKNKTFWTTKPALSNDTKLETDEIAVLPEQNLIPSPALLIFLVITGLIAYTIAGEKMPWLTLHIVFPMLLTAAWAFNYLFQKLSSVFIHRDTLFHAGILALVINSLFMFIRLIGNKMPFQGKTQLALQHTNLFLFLLVLETGLIICLYLLDTKDKFKKLKYTALIGMVIIMTLITTRASFRASFINYDYPKEYLVYAHAADGPKQVLDQIEEISKRITGGLDLKVAYDNHGLYPYWWYLRHYPNKVAYMEDPTRTLEDVPLIIAGQDKYAKLEPIVRENYDAFEYPRLWWPMQDYWNLNWERISSALVDKDMRQALFNIWFDRDYSLYAQVTEDQHLRLETWLPSDRMRLYIRKDIAAQLWEYTTDASLEYTIESDPYEEKMVSYIPDGFISMSGNAPGDLNSPRGIDIAPDGTIYVADSLNHRIQQFSKDGMLLNVWGTFTNILESDAPGGTFNEPWDVAISPEGYIFVADTFNHRIQKFDPTGRFLKMWGVFAQGDSPESFWGPRGIAINAQGNVFVTDTGNKRVVVFDKDLNYITQFGGGGFEPGQFDEPVGITINNAGQIIVADTWNRRVQIFEPDTSGTVFTPINNFDVNGWYGQSIDNKPYLAVDKSDHIYITDPEIGRILEFSPTGEFLNGYQDINTSDDLHANPFGIDIDENGILWFGDASANIISFIIIP